MTTTISTIEKLNEAISNASLLQLPSIMMPGGSVSFTNTGFIRSNGDKIFVCRIGDNTKLIIQYTIEDWGHNTWQYAYENLLENISEKMETLTKVDVCNDDVFNAMTHYAKSFFFTH